MKIINNALITVPRKHILHRLKFNKHKNIDSDKFLKIIEHEINMTSNIIIYDIVDNLFQDNKIVIDNVSFESNLVTKFMKNSKKILLMASTVTEDTFSRYQKYKEQDMTKYIILDAVLSEKTDYGLDFLQNTLNRELLPQGMKTGKRISCGYGDFDIKNQEFFYNYLNLKKYNITLSENYIMVPEKTVTAICGIF